MIDLQLLGLSAEIDGKKLYGSLFDLGSRSGTGVCLWFDVAVLGRNEWYSTITRSDGVFRTLFKHLISRPDVNTIIMYPQS